MISNSFWLQGLLTLEHWVGFSDVLVGWGSSLFCFMKQIRWWDKPEMKQLKRGSSWWDKWRGFYCVWIHLLNELSNHFGHKYISAQCYRLLLYLYCSEEFKFNASVISSLKLCGPLPISQDHCCRMTEQTEQKTKLTGRWEKCITGSRGDPNWCVGWIMHLSRSFQSCNFAKWQWSKLSLEGMVLSRRLKWLRECKRKHQRGREDISVSCQILSWLVLHLHFPSLSLSSYPGNTNRSDNSVWKQLPG